MIFLEDWTAKANSAVIDAIAGKERYIVGNILNVVRIIGIGLALIMATWMSIQYFSADGRGAPWAAERKADVKGKQLMNFAVGFMIFLGAGSIIMLISNFVADIFSATGK